VKGSYHRDEDAIVRCDMILLGGAQPKTAGPRGERRRARFRSHDYSISKVGLAEDLMLEQDVVVEDSLLCLDSASLEQRSVLRSLCP